LAHTDDGQCTRNAEYAIARVFLRITETKTQFARNRLDRTCRHRGQECSASKQLETDFSEAAAGAILRKCREDKAFSALEGVARSEAIVFGTTFSLVAQFAFRI
jgi:hypothetical protein